MPSLAHLKRGLTAEAIQLTNASNRGPSSKSTRSLHLGLARMVDHGIEQYEVARMHFAEWNHSLQLGGLIAGVSSLECALVATHRAVEFLHRLRLRGMRLVDGSPVVKRPGEFPLLSDAIRKRIKDVRDEIQHIDERMWAAVDDPDVPINIVAEHSRVLAGSFQVEYLEWSEWLSALHSETARISQLERHPQAPVD